MGVQGGTAAVRAKLAKLVQAGVPLAALWIQDWTGKRATSFGDRLLWNWIVDDAFYPGWWDLIADLNAQPGGSVKMLTYINAYLADEAPTTTSGGKRVPQPLFQQAKALGCLIRDRNNNTLIQISATADFTFGTVDLTNPACRVWYVNIMRQNMMNVSASAASGFPVGAVGWMADFAESLPLDAQLFAGDAREVHNLFPTLWAETCREAIDVSVGASPSTNFSSEAVFFTRSGTTTHSRWTTLQWLGDQTAVFNAHDGLTTVVLAHASGGMSGFPLNHADVGGYLSVSQFGLVKVLRSREVLLRWMELSAFTDVMFRSHEGNLPNVTPQVYSDAELLAAFAKFAKVFAALAPYRRKLVDEAASTGRPYARAVFLHYPDDPATYSITSQIMVGPDVMVCPVLRAGASSVDCYLPVGSGPWTGVFDTSIRGSGGFVVKSCPAPLGQPCVLVRDSPAMAEAVSAIAAVRVAVGAGGSG